MTGARPRIWTLEELVEHFGVRVGLAIRRMNGSVLTPEAIAAHTWKVLLLVHNDALQKGERRLSETRLTRIVMEEAEKMALALWRQRNTR
jgi:hypothetical protein